MTQRASGNNVPPRKSRAGVRDDTKHAIEGRATRQLVLPISAATDDTHLTVKDELTDTNVDQIHGHGITTKLVTHIEALQKGSEFTSI